MRRLPPAGKPNGSRRNDGVMDYTTQVAENPALVPTKLDCALERASAGFRVFPVEINGKTPAVSGDWQKIATRDPDKIKALWTDPVFGTAMDYNIGVALDRDTLVVDVDVRDGKQGASSLAFWEAINDPLPDTYTVKTASGGEHRYFKVDDSRHLPKELAKHVDLKGYGGYVVGPGSSIDGRAYRTREEGGSGKIADAPGWLCNLPTPKRNDNRERGGAAKLAAVVELDTPDAIARAKDWLSTSAPDSGTFKVACRLKDFGLSQDMCLELMFEDWAGADSRDTEHIAFRVANAYHYGQNPIGIRSPEAEFDAVEIARENAAIGTSITELPVEDFEDIEIDTSMQSLLVDEVLETDTCVLGYGPSNVGKSFAFLDMALAVASGTHWNGHKVNKGLVIWNAAEGGKGFRKRLVAARQQHPDRQAKFSLISRAINMSTTAGVKALLEVVRHKEKKHSEKCRLIVLDTLARTFGAADENSAADMGRYISHCDYVRRETGATILIIHHTGHNKAHARGSYALLAAVDTEIRVEADGALRGKMISTKQKDTGGNQIWPFRLKSVRVATRDDGMPITSCVVEWRADASDEFEPKLTGAHQPVWEAIEALFAAEKKAARSGQLTFTAIVSVVHKRIGLEKTLAAAKGRVNRALPILIEQGLIRETETKQYVRGSVNV